MLAVVTVFPGDGGIVSAPTGTIWVVKDIDAFIPGDEVHPNQSAAGFFINDPIGTSVFNVVPALQNYWYHFETRRVVAGLQWGATDAGWSINVAGYQLTLP